jgi:hypothetical protein
VVGQIRDQQVLDSTAGFFQADRPGGISRGSKQNQGKLGTNYRVEE